MYKILTVFLTFAVLFQLSAATNYALRTLGSGFAGDVKAHRAIDGKVGTYWGFHPYPKVLSFR